MGTGRYESPQGVWLEFLCQYRVTENLQPSQSIQMDEIEGVILVALLNGKVVS